MVVHGGAWAMPDGVVQAHMNGVNKALAEGWRVLERGGRALDAVQAAITYMEDDDTFDAGRGSFLTRDGRVQLDALMMDGSTMRAGGVACVERLHNPIQAARIVLDKSPHVYFVGTGAERFATQHGMRLVDNTDLIVPRERERLMRFQQAELAGHPDTTFSGNSEFTATPSANSADPALRQTALDTEVEQALPEEVRINNPTLHSHDTVGAVALDAEGRLAAGTSTGGTLSKAPGRVGDSSLIGCGCYADND